MTRRLPALAVLAVAVALPPSASARGGIAVLDTGPGPAGVVQMAPVRVSGAITVEFRGDRASGCEVAGLCGVSGTVTWTPGRSAELLTFGARRHGEPVESGVLAFVGARGNSTSAQVRREGTPAGLCADAGGQEFGFMDLGTRPGSSLDVGPLGAPGGFDGSDSFRTRCAGPSQADLSALLPTRRLTRGDLRHGHVTLDYAVDAPFASHGLAGTLHSDVTMAVGATTRQDAGRGGSAPPELRTRRRRQLEVEYRIERVTGETVTTFAGLADPDLCGPLDACGLTGTTTLSPRAISGTAFVDATGSSRSTPLELRRAVGLAPGRRPAGIAVSGSGSWDRDTGSVLTSLTRAGRADCNDAGPIPGGGSVALSFTRRSRVRATYGNVEGGVSGDPLRTRCQGPGLADVARSRPLASGTLPLSAFGHRHVTLRLTTGAPFESDGYSGRTSPHVTVEMTRVAVHRSVVEEPDFTGLRAVFRRALRR